MLVSLSINVAVLIPISVGLLVSADWIERAYGPSTPARGILLSVYLAILLVSAWQLRAMDRGVVGPLLLIQVLYKLTTPFTVSDLSNPVVLSNLAISVVHLATLQSLRAQPVLQESPSEAGSLTRTPPPKA